MNVLQGFGLFFLVGGVVGVWGGVERIFRKRARVRRAVAVNARIVAVESDGIAEDSNVTWYFPVMTYTVEGRAIRVKLPKGTVRREDHRVGGTIRVYYDPLDPTRAAARLRDFPGGWAATILAVVFAAIGAGLCWAGWNGER